MHFLLKKKLEIIEIDPDAHSFKLVNNQVCEHCKVVKDTKKTIYAVSGTEDTYTTSYSENTYWEKVLGENGIGGTLRITSNVIIKVNYTIYKGTLQIMNGVKVTVPYSNAFSEKTDDFIKGGSVGITPFCTLTLKGGASIVIDLGGTLLINSQVITIQPYMGQAGLFGQLTMEENSTMSVNGSLYARGYILGDGSIVAENEAKLYVLLAIGDWRGGTFSTANAKFCLPFNYYELNNIQVSCTYNYGSSLLAMVRIVAAGMGVAAQVPVIGIDDTSMFQMLASASVNKSKIVTKCIDEFNTNTNIKSVTFPYSKLDIELYRGIATHDITVSAAGVSFSSKGLYLPFYGNVTVKANTMLTVYNSLKLLPGSVFKAEKGSYIMGMVSEVSRILLYDAEQWNDNYYISNYLTTKRTAKDVKVDCEATLSDFEFYYSGTEKVSEDIKFGNKQISILTGDYPNKIIFFEPLLIGKVYVTFNLLKIA